MFYILTLTDKLFEISSLYYSEGAMCNKVPNIEIQNGSTRKFPMIMDCVSTATDHSFPSTAEFKTTGNFVCCPLLFMA